MDIADTLFEGNAIDFVGYDTLKQDAWQYQYARGAAIFINDNQELDHLVNISRCTFVGNTPEAGDSGAVWWDRHMVEPCEDQSGTNTCSQHNLPWGDDCVVCSGAVLHVDGSSRNSNAEFLHGGRDACHYCYGGSGADCAATARYRGHLDGSYIQQMPDDYQGGPRLLDNSPEPQSFGWWRG